MPNLPEIELFSVDSLEQLAERLPRRTPFFTLFLAGEAPLEEPEALSVLLRPLVDNGLIYFCTWGPGCEELHDALDLTISQKEQDQEYPLPYTLLSSSHDGEALGEALRFFSDMALPTEPSVFANFSRYAVALGSPALTHRLQQAFLRQGIIARQIDL